MDKLIGTTVESYKFLNVIDTGGMAIIYRAENIETREYVAIKVLLSHLQHQDEIVERFHREARNAAALDHPNIIPILHEGLLEDGRPYIVMALADGKALSYWIQHYRKPFPLKQVDSILKQIASALDYAHQHNVIHRDVKPSNILMTQDGKAMLGDFGIARSLQDSRLTSVDTRLGSPTYMSPEQAKGLPITTQSDVYSLGVVVYELLTGHSPFQGDTTAVLFQHVHQMPAPLRQLNPSIPTTLEKVVDKALAKNPKDRYKSPGEFANAFQENISGKKGWMSNQKFSSGEFALGGVLALVLVLLSLALTINVPPHSSRSAVTVQTVTPTGFLIPTATAAPSSQISLSPKNLSATELMLLRPLNNESFTEEAVIHFNWEKMHLDKGENFRLVIKGMSPNNHIIDIRTTDISATFQPEQLLPDNYSWMVIVERQENGKYQEIARSDEKIFSVLTSAVKHLNVTATVTATETPVSVTPTAAPSPILSAPILQAPFNDEHFRGYTNVINLQWSNASRPLGNNEYYVLIIEHVQGIDFTWLKTPYYSIGEQKRWLIDLGPIYHWQVVVAHQRTGEPNEDPAGKESSAYSERRVFHWEK